MFDPSSDTLMRPWLIQRATIRSPLEAGSGTLSKAVSFDYMGSSEFEMGALPESLRRLEATRANVQLRVVPELLDGEVPLRVLSALSEVDFAEYRRFLIKLRTAPRYTVSLKERSEFGLAERQPLYPEPKARRKQPRYTPSYADFWWDIGNDVMWSFHKTFMNRLEEYLTSSFAVMNSRAK